MATRMPAGMADRIKAILLQPKVEWERIDAEPMTERGILTGWVLPLAAIGPVAGLIGGLVFGYGAFGISYRPSIAGAVTTAVLGYVMALVGVFVLAKIIDALAPTFGGARNGVQAMKVAAFASTASYVAGVFQLVPAIAWLGLLGIYSLYLLYLGLPKLMRAPADKALPYTAVTCLAAIVLMLVAGLVVSSITARFAAPAFTAGTIDGAVSVPGLGNVDLAKLEAASKRMEAQATAMQNGTIKVADANALAALLPASAAGWTRTEVESHSGAAGGVGGAVASGKYTSGEQSVTLAVTDMAAMAALAAMGGALNIQSNKTTADGYEKTAQVDGRMTTEEWSTAEKRGKYSTIVAERFMIEADGSAADIDALKSLVASIDLGKLEAMAK